MAGGTSYDRDQDKQIQALLERLEQLEKAQAEHVLMWHRLTKAVDTAPVEPEAEPAPKRKRKEG